MTETPEDAQLVRKSVSLPAGVWQQVDNYRFENRIKKEAEAVRRLILAGLSAKSIVEPSTP